tara:strand:+ start:1037 stop:1198 length:162 start_codon:yes stop_codon:yes gene_type:complete
MDGLELWLHNIRRFRLDPKEALNTMEANGKNIVEVLLYIEKLLESYTLKHKGE